MARAELQRRARAELERRQMEGQQQSGMQQQQGMPQDQQPQGQSFLDKAKEFGQEALEGLPAHLQAAGGLAQGVANIGPGLANLGIKGVNAATGMQVPEYKSFDVMPDTLATKLGGIGSYFVGPGVLSAGAKAIHGLPGIAKAFSSMSNSLKSAPKIEKAVNALNAPAAGALTGAAMEPENQLGGAIGGGIVGSLFPAGKAAVNALRPSNLFRGKQTPDELRNALELTKGTETPLGDVLQSPFLKYMHENVLSKIPFSGAVDKMQQTGKQLVERGQGLMKELLGKNDPKNYETAINDALKEAKVAHTKIKQSLYDDSDKIAKEAGLKLELPTFSKEAQGYMKAIEGTNILKTEPEVASLFKRLKNYASPVEKVAGKILDKEGKPIVSSMKYPSLKEANILKGKLSEIADNYRSSPNISDRNLASVFSKLSKSLGSDIKSGIKKTGNKQLESSYNKAEKNYAENYSQFLDRDINKFAEGRADPETILQYFIKTGKNTDRSILLDKLVGKLPEDKRKLLGYGYLKRATDESGVIDPLKLKQLISKKALGEKQFETLFPDAKFRKKLKDFSELSGKNAEAFDLMRNPKTGNRLSDFIPLTAATMAGSAFGPAGALAAGIGVPYAARQATNALTSPKVREKLINAMLEK